MMGIGMAVRPPRQLTLTQRAIGVIRRYGADANLWASGVGWVNGVQAGNYIDSLGTTAGAYDSPLGMALDANGVVGPNLFSDATVSFGGEATRVSPGVYRLLSSAGAYSAIVVLPVPAGKTYELTFNVDSVEVAGSGFALDPGSLQIPATVGPKRIVQVSAATTLTIKRAGAAMDCQISNISVREVTGNHATQATAASKPTLRRGLVNLLTESDFRNGLTDAPTRGGLVTASTLTGYGGAIAFGHDGSASSYAYKPLTTTVGAPYTLAVVVRMDDLSAPAFGSPSANSAANTMALVLSGYAQSPTTYSVEPIGEGFFIVLASAVVASTGAPNFGVLKYNTNNSRTFKVTRYGLFQGTVTAQQILAAGGIPVTTTAPASSTGGRPYWEFDGANDFLQTGITTGNEGWICAGVTPRASNFMAVAGNGSTASIPGCSLLIRLDGQIWGQKSSGSAEHVQIIAPAGSVTPSNPVVIGFGWNPAGGVGSLNNTEGTNTSAIAVSAASPLLIGEKGNNSERLNGSMSAILYFSVLPSAQDRAILRKWVGSLQGQTL